MCENKNLSYFMYLSGVGMGRVKMGGGMKRKHWPYVDLSKLVFTFDVHLPGSINHW